jgi:hypothetical protein
MGSRIGGHHIQIGLNGLPDAAFRRVARDVRGRRFALPQCFSEAFERQIEAEAFLMARAGALPVAKQIDDRLGRIEDGYRHTLDEAVRWRGAADLWVRSPSIRAREWYRSVHGTRPEAAIPLS